MSLSIGCTDWHSGDVIIGGGDSGYRQYVIYAFGRTAKSTLVTLVITGYKPCGYLEVPQECKRSDSAIVRAFKSFIIPTKEEKELSGNEGVSYAASKCVDKISVVRRNRFRGFDDNTLRRYVKIECSTRYAIRAVGKLFQKIKYVQGSDRGEPIPKAVDIDGITKGYQIVPMYEFGMDPLLRFFHDKQIQPAHWITFRKAYAKTLKNITNTKTTLAIDWKFIRPREKPPCEIPWVVASFDIECLSSHGDFPQPIKDYKKPARDLIEFVDTIDKKAVLTRAQYRTFLKHWFVGDDDGKNSRKPSIRSLPKCWSNINGIFTKRGRKPSNGQIDALVEETYSIVFENRGSAQPLRIAKLFNQLTDVLMPRIQIAPDRVVQIGTSFWKYGDDKPYRHTMITMGDCSPIPNTDVYSFKTEAELLIHWNHIMKEELPDIITGYNIFGFDIPYLYKRAMDEGVLDEVFCLSRFKSHVSELKTKQVKGIGGALVEQEYVETPGMVQLDLMNIIKRDHNLDSYKLDNVAANFLRGKVKGMFKNDAGGISIKTTSVAGLEIDNSISLRTTEGYVEEKWGKARYDVVGIDKSEQVIHLGDSFDISKVPSDLVWCMGKNDVGPQDIFRLCRGSADDQCIVAKYCVQDVVLVLHLMKQLQMLPNNVAMGNVCSVPFGWIVSRGQGIKIQSLVAKQCQQRGYLCPDLDKSKFGKDTFEGAIVLPPTPGMYLEEPVAVLDYASLYPSSMISMNLSHESYCDDPKWQGEDGAKRLEEKGYEYEDVQYDTFSLTYTPSGLVKDKVKTGVKTVRFVQGQDGKKGIIPEILENLLAARKETRTRMKYKTLTLASGEIVEGIAKYDEESGQYKVDGKTYAKSEVKSVVNTYTPFQKEVMDGQQLAYKITANSLYGQIGARTSYIYWKDIAAATTATGRKQLEIAQTYCEDHTNFPQKLDDGETIYLKNKVVYGDTDSVFVKYDCRYPDGTKMKGRDALKRSIELGCQSEEGIQKLLKAPQRLEYEKTFWPFMLFTKKRYVGDKYEFDPNKSKRTSMGIVLKRRDNAPIVKVLYGGVIDTIMETQDTGKALDNLQRGLFNLIRGKFDISNLIITKTLAPYYKRPETIAHKILADRMFERDPGNAPQVNDRIPYIHVKINKPKTKIKPGENIEHPEYIKQQKLKIDYRHYISNQIMKPVSQIFALAPHLVPGTKVREDWFDKVWDKYEETGLDREEARKKAQDESQKIVQRVLFDDILIQVKNSEDRQTEITKWFPRVG